MTYQSSSQKLGATSSTPKKIAPKKKSSKGSSSSQSPEPFLRDTTQLFSMNHLDFDEPIRVMIAFIANHPISIPLTKISYPLLPLNRLHTAFTRIKIDNGVLETKITGDKIVPIHKSMYLRGHWCERKPQGF